MLLLHARNTKHIVMYNDALSRNKDYEPLPAWMTTDIWREATKGYRNYISNQDYFDILEKAKEIAGEDAIAKAPKLEAPPVTAQRASAAARGTAFVMDYNEPMPSQQAPQQTLYNSDADPGRANMRETLKDQTRLQLFGLYQETFGTKADKACTANQLIDLIIDEKFKS